MTEEEKIQDKILVIAKKKFGDDIKVIKNRTKGNVITFSTEDYNISLKYLPNGIIIENSRIKRHRKKIDTADIIRSSVKPLPVKSKPDRAVDTDIIDEDLADNASLINSADKEKKKNAAEQEEKKEVSAKTEEMPDKTEAEDSTSETHDDSDSVNPLNKPVKKDANPFRRGDCVCNKYNGTPYTVIGTAGSIVNAVPNEGAYTPMLIKAADLMFTDREPRELQN